MIAVHFPFLENANVPKILQPANGHSMVHSSEFGTLMLEKSEIKKLL
jgi:hypothetical protein